eukprot:6256010-Prymnesium_polylepis.1
MTNAARDTLSCARYSSRPEKDAPFSESLAIKAAARGNRAAARLRQRLSVSAALTASSASRQALHVACMAQTDGAQQTCSATEKSRSDGNESDGRARRAGGAVCDMAIREFCHVASRGKTFYVAKRPQPTTRPDTPRHVQQAS